MTDTTALTAEALFSIILFELNWHTRDRADRNISIGFVLVSVVVSEPKTWWNPTQHYIYKHNNEMVVVEEKVSSYLSYFHPEDKLMRRWACIRDVFVVFISGQGQSRISTAHRKSLQYIYSHFACYDWVNLLINKHFSYQPAYPFDEWYLSIFLIDSTENVGAHQLTHRVESSRPAVCTVYLYYILEGWHRANIAVPPPKPTQRMSKDNHRPRNRILLYTINWALNLIFECAMLRLVYLFSLSLSMCVCVLCVCLFVVPSNI